MATPLPPVPGMPVARQAREQFVTEVGNVLPPLSDAIRLRLIELVDGAKSTRDIQERRDAMFDFDRLRSKWVESTNAAWRAAVIPPTVTSRVRVDALNLELIADDVVEMKILSSRLSLAIQEKATWELNDLRLRMQHLEGGDDLAGSDVLRSETIAQVMIEQWTRSELARSTWVMVSDVIQRHMVEHALKAYHLTNEFLIEHEVLRDISLHARPKRSAAPVASRRSGGLAAPEEDSSVGGESHSGGGGGKGHAGTRGSGGGGGSGDRNGGGSGAGGDGGDSRGSGYHTQGRAGHQGSPQRGGGTGGSQRASGFAGDGAGAGDGGFYGSINQTVNGGSGDVSTQRSGGVHDETRMMTNATPMGRARQRANGVLGQLRRMLADRVAGFDITHETRPSPAVEEALSRHSTQLQATVQEIGSVRADEVVVYDDAGVEQVAVALRKRTGELKEKATTSTEKATIEIVALMFQSILAEERIPPAVRVWFARLQMPVLRLAIAEPEFFGSLQHPARQLIDRLGSCVMGFDAATIGGSALEAEIKRVVQVIEQYPETGRRVFQLVYDEFQKFLALFLTEKGQTQRLVTVAQQVEQKETMAIQYTIEMRSMLNDMPVREEIREFLFKVWAEVLAVAAVKNGPQHAETIALKKSASELVWAASAKPNRNDRARVIQDLPQLLQRLRQGMTLLGLQGVAQEMHIKTIGDTLADAFQSKTEAISQARIEAMATRLANLEDFVADDPATDLPLDADSIEMILGIDASMIEVVADGGSKPGEAMIAWAQELQLGNWFSLDHNGKTTHVQYAWRSDRRQLHLFASTEGRSFLIQARRLAAYLQAGLLLPTEEEALSVRATRDALAKLDANPERLLT